MAWGSNPFTSYSTMPYGQSNTWAGGQGSPWGQQNGAWNQDALTFNSQNGGFAGAPSMSTPYQVNQPNVQQYQNPGASRPPPDTFNAPMYTNGQFTQQPGNSQMPPWMQQGMPPWMMQGGMPPWMQGYGMGGNSNPYTGGMGPNGYQMFPGMNFGQQPNGNPAARGNNTLGVFGNQGANPGQLKPMQVSGPNSGAGGYDPFSRTPPPGSTQDQSGVWHSPWGSIYDSGFGGWGKPSSAGPQGNPQNNYGQPTQLQTMQPGATPAPGQTAFSTQELQSGQFAAPTTDSRLPSITAGMLGMGGQAPDPNMFWNQTRNRWEY